MKVIQVLFLFFSIMGYSQYENIDTIYGKPKSVREKVTFLNIDKQNVRLFEIDGDYGHATIFTPENIRSAFNCNWFEMIGCSYINYKKDFLKNGKPSKETWYNKDGSFKRQYNYAYNKNGMLVEKKEIYFDNEFYVTKFNYNYKNKISSYISIFSDETDTYNYVLFEYDSLDNMIKRSNFHADGYSSSLYYRYNKENKLIRKFRHKPFKWKNNTNGGRTFMPDSAGTWDSLVAYEYDYSGNMIKEKYYNEEDGKISSKKLYKYDSLNNLIEINYARDTIYAFRRFNFNKQSLRIGYEYRVLEHPNSGHIVQYYYDSNKNIGKTIYTDLNSSKERKHIIDFKYQFDKKGNWTRITKIVNGVPLYVWTRKIKYY